MHVFLNLVHINIISIPGSFIAGLPYTLRCSVDGTSERVSYEWSGPSNGQTVTNTSTRMVISNSSISLLQFTSLQPSHDGLYTCKATVMGNADAVIAENITVTVNGMSVFKVINN